jgi:hypothetical protein
MGQEGRIVKGTKNEFSRTGRGENMRKAPAYRRIPLNVAHSACKTEPEGTEILPRTGCSPNRGVPVIGVQL